MCEICRTWQHIAYTRRYAEALERLYGTNAATKWRDHIQNLKDSVKGKLPCVTISIPEIIDDKKARANREYHESIRKTFSMMSEGATLKEMMEAGVLTVQVRDENDTWRDLT